MPKKLLFLVIDDSEPVLEIYIALLSKAGHDVVAHTSCDQALEYIIEHQPDCVLCDLILPGLDGIELLKQVRNQAEIKQPAFIIVSGKQFDYDRRRALEAGADAYLTKPIDPEKFLPEILANIYSRIKIKFWGIRGTLPVPGMKSLRYGGNTNCITLNISNKHHFIFDAGTGIKELSNCIISEDLLPYKAKIFISHPHYDHINGIPYFMPLYMKGNDFEFLGSDQGSVSLKQYLSDQMDSVYFPVTMSEFSSTVKFRSLTEETFMIDDIKIETILLNHPGRCLGFRVEYKGKVFCYITDNELYLKTDVKHYNEEEVNRLIRFINEADVLIIDATYTDEEYVEKIGWGHSPLSNVVDIADKAKVKLLCLHHHDPDQTDDDIDKKLLIARAILSERKSNTKCIAPHEGDEIIL